MWKGHLMITKKAIMLLQLFLFMGHCFALENANVKTREDPLTNRVSLNSHQYADFSQVGINERYFPQWNTEQSSTFSKPSLQLAATRGLNLKPVEANHTPSVNRIALIIGNSEYVVSPLNNPGNDALDVSSQLKQMGFDVSFLANADKTQMLDAILQFGRNLESKNSVGLFYYAGHGMQVNGRNFLIPVDADINLEHQIEYEAVDVGRVLAAMDAAQNLMNMIVLDACRDNPFKRSFRSSAKGLAQMDAPSGTFIAYSTAPGQVAQDGDGRNGIYTQNLLKHLNTPGLTVEEMFKRVRVDVMAETDNQQVPWESSSLVGVFYFVPSDQLPPAWVPPALIKYQPKSIKPPWYKRKYVWAIVAAVTAVVLWKCSGGGDGGDAGQGGAGGGCSW